MESHNKSFRDVVGWIMASGVVFGLLHSGNEAQPQVTEIGKAADVKPVDYLTQVKPLLRERCYACHGALKQQAGLRMDTAASLLRGGESGPVVVPGKPETSRFIERVSTTDLNERMPPEHEGEPLTSEQINVLTKWIASGALPPTNEQAELDPRDHWAFQAIRRSAIPRVECREWLQNPVDAFVARRHEQMGLKRQPEAARLTLLRRISLDLIGLPPTFDEIAALNADSDPQWYERTVTRLLNDPRHGERWGRHWMDIWRYSDWWGLGDQLRNSQKHIWHWRDWIIESVNADTPYDEIVRLMLAADELHPNDLDQLRATGFLARNYFLFNRNQWMDETVEHVSKGFLGLTTNCAKCHDHKYDPITHADYYQLRAIFEPYHVRVDVTPDEADLSRDGIPRAFDGHLDLPTYRFIRGQENNPDKSTVIHPGLPKFLDFASLSIEPVELPGQAWQPGLRPWIAAAHQATARRNREALERKLGTARDKLTTAERQEAARPALATTASSPTTDQTASASPPIAMAVADARLEFRIAELAVAVARIEEQLVGLRAAAMRAAVDQGAGAAAVVEAAVDARRTAALAAGHAERELEVARARHAVAEAELRLHKAAADKQDAITKEVAAAREALEKSLKRLEEPNDQFQKLVGAAWTPTRFFNSGKDDPEVTFPPRSSGRRTALAEWITHPKNPLTARVAVNHIWARHFGTPLVPTVFDFGRKGIPPANPELLDWLAAELIESGWSMKHLHRLIVQSATYRQASSWKDEEANGPIDRENAHYWRRPTVRMESQVVRDSILALAGTLDFTQGGPPILQASQTNSTRRSLYFFHSNNDRNLFLTMFDEALVKECYRREQSIVPQQALALSNSQLVLDAAPRIAQRCTQEMTKNGHTAEDDVAFIQIAFNALLGAQPSEEEVAAMTEALAAWKTLPDAPPGESAIQFARTNLIWVLLNHHDFLTLK